MSAPRAVVVLPGDGIGPDVIDAARRVVDATGVRVEWDVHEVGAAAFDRTGDALPADTIAAIRAAGVALKGPVSTPADGRFRSVNVRLRQELDLYLQVRRCRSFTDPAVDVVVARETTEDLYAGLEVAADAATAEELRTWVRDHVGPVAPRAAIGLKPVSADAVARAARGLAAYLAPTGTRSVTVVHKATAMPATDGLFLRTAHAALTDVGLDVDSIAVDVAAAECVRRPARFHVLFTGNLYGDILADLLGAVVGGVGLVPGANLGDEVAVFEPAHGSAPRHAGFGRANPTAAVLSGALLLRSLGETHAAERVEQAVAAVLAEGRRVTYDVAAPGVPPVSTSAMADAFISALG